MISKQSTKKTIGKFQLKQKLGQGSFGTGYLAWDTIECKNVCVKVFENYSETSVKTAFAEREAAKMQHHPNVITMFGCGEAPVFLDGKVASQDLIYMVSEYCEKGEAFEFVKLAGFFCDRLTRGFSSQILDGLQHIHQQFIAHRDLKLENIFLDANARPIVSDLGFSKSFAGGAQLKTNLGTSSYMAPELYNNEPYKGQPVDVFALGQVLFLIRTGTFAFHKSKRDAQYTKLQEKPKNYLHALSSELQVDDEFINLVQGMTRKDPKMRMTIQQVREHAWFQREERASGEDILNYFNHLVEEKNIAMQHADPRAGHRYVVERNVMRSNNRKCLGPSKYDLAEWEDLVYKPFNPEVGHFKQLTSYFSHSVGENIFESMWEFFKSKYQDQVEVKLPEKPITWKLKVTVTKQENTPKNSELEESKEQVLEKTKTSFTVTIRQVLAGKTPKLPQMVNVNFKRKEGDVLFFKDLIKEAMESDLLKMFACMPPLK